MIYRLDSTIQRLNNWGQMVEQWNRDGGTVENLIVEQWNICQWNRRTSDGGTVEHLMLEQWII